GTPVRASWSACTSAWKLRPTSSTTWRARWRRWARAQARPPSPDMSTRDLQPRRTFWRPDLRQLILMLCILSVLLALIGSFHASYRVQRGTLLENTLEANRVYTAKVAS